MEIALGLLLVRLIGLGFRDTRGAKNSSAGSAATGGRTGGFFESLRISSRDALRGFGRRQRVARRRADCAGARGADRADVRHRSDGRRDLSLSTGPNGFSAAKNGYELPLLYLGFPRHSSRSSASARTAWTRRSVGARSGRRNCLGRDRAGHRRRAAERPGAAEARRRSLQPKALAR